jgi:hypothetical protein
MIRWVTTTRAALQKEAAQLPPRAEHGTLAGAVRRYFETATLSSTNRQRLTQQLGFWCAQPAALGAPVLTPDAFHADREANRGRTLGEAALVRMKFGNAFALSLPPAVLDRIRKVLREAFAPTDPDNNPTEFANTANHYRGALLSLFAVLNENVAGAPNPITLIKTRSRDEAALSGQDMRIVREILAQLPTKFGRPSDLGERRLAVLAWVHLTPKQLSQLSPPQRPLERRTAARDDPSDAVRRRGDARVRRRAGRLWEVLNGLAQ